MTRTPFLSAAENARNQTFPPFWHPIALAVVEGLQRICSHMILALEQKPPQLLDKPMDNSLGNGQG